MLDREKIKTDLKEIQLAINGVYRIAEEFDIDHGSNLADFMENSFHHVEKKLLKIAIEGINKRISKALSSESVDNFINDNLIKSLDSKVSTSDLYAFYCHRCQLKGIKPATKIELTKGIKAKFGKDTYSKLFKINKKVVRCYVGFELRK